MRKSLLIPIIVLVCLGLFILFVFVLPRHQEEKSVLAPWNQKPITHLTIVHQQDEIVLTLQEQPTTQWYITSPRRALAEYGTVNQILQGLAAVGKYATPVEDPDPVAHGLDKPWLQISLGDATERTLLSLGKQTFNGRHYYMSSTIRQNTTGAHPGDRHFRVRGTVLHHPPFQKHCTLLPLERGELFPRWFGSGNRRS